MLEMFLIVSSMIQMNSKISFPTKPASNIVDDVKPASPEPSVDVEPASNVVFDVKLVSPAPPGTSVS